MKIDPIVSLDNFHRDAVWKGNDLMFHRRVVASIVPDPEWPRMWRVRLPNGHTTDMVNLSRARDAARFLALKALTVSRVEAPPMRLNGGGRYSYGGDPALNILDARKEEEQAVAARNAALQTEMNSA